MGTAGGKCVVLVSNQMSAFDKYWEGTFLALVRSMRQTINNLLAELLEDNIGLLFVLKECLLFYSKE
jgi:hypothetical protein